MLTLAMKVTKYFKMGPLCSYSSRARSHCTARPFALLAALTATRRSGLQGAALAVGLILTIPTIADGRQPVYYAGLAYLGDFQYVDANYPITRALNNEDGALDVALAGALRAVEPEHLELRDTLADLDRTDTVVLAIAVDRERISRELFDFRHGLRTKLIVELSLQVLFYDLAAGTLVDNVPVSAAINHVLDDRNVNIDAEALELARTLYFGDVQTAGLLAQAAERIGQVRPAAADGLRFKLESMGLSERLQPLLPGHRTEDQVRQGLGQWFSARLAEHTGVSVIPFTRGYAIGNQLPGRFANGEAFNLTLPEPDYAIHVDFKNLVKQDTGDKLIYGAQARFRLEEPFTQTVSIDGDYRTGIYKIASESRIEEDDWSAYEDAAESLLDDLVEQLKTPKRSWHGSHARDKHSFSQFNDNKELFND